MINTIAKPAINPDGDDVADWAKWCYAHGTARLAALHYRLAELAGTGQLDADESLDLQSILNDVSEYLYWGTTSAVRDWSTDTPDWDDGHYSNGGQVMNQKRIEENAANHWEHNSFLFQEVAVLSYPMGTVSTIAAPPRGHGRDREETIDFTLRSRQEGKPHIGPHQ
ncbi:hypothetical protein NJB18091_37090 [Mycobacterium marinum]|uniref:hypothetical protein n=1 Tax=Mycobacterium marinum TaxID=1781 RepID=UPI0021C3002E|nr:hypothetical protein [Mycobacterium marinum]GJO02321.1 hypothetical protein NJB18091_37090 [Mycobacterium marinum]